MEDMIRFAYPNVNHENRFTGCGRFVVFASGETPGDGYERAAIDPSTVENVYAAADILLQNSTKSTRVIYEIKDQPGREYRGYSLNLAYLLALIHCVKAVKLENFKGDIWCTGGIEIVGGQPKLTSVYADKFEKKLEAFLADDNPDSLFIVSASNIADQTVRGRHLDTQDSVRELSLDELTEHSLASGQKTILKVRRKELPQLIDALFIAPDVPEKPDIKELAERQRRLQELERQEPLRRRRIRLRGILTNLILGLLVFITLLFFTSGAKRMQYHPKVVIEQLQQLVSGNVPGLNPTAPSFVFVEIDEDTYQKWGEPPFTPRDKLLRLIQFAVDSNASIILVDISLQGGDLKNLNKAEQDIKKYVSGYSGHCREKISKDSRCPQIIFARKLRLPPDEESCSDILPSFLDKEVKKSPDIHWGVPSFAGKRGDPIHEQRLWESACSESGEPEVVPAMSLLAVAFFKSPNLPPEAILPNIQDALRSFLPTQCQATDGLIRSKCVAMTQLKNPLQIGAGDDALQLSRIQQRIVYRIPWQEEISLWKTNTSAQAVLDALEKQDEFSIDKELIQDRIVIIGGSFQDSKDIHMTPSGDLPGVLILLNGIYSLLHYGELRSLSLVGKLAIEALFILSMSCLLVRFHSFRGIVLSGIVVYCVSFFLMGLFFRASVWFIFALPVFVGQLRHIAAEFRMEAKYKQFREHVNNT